MAPITLQEWDELRSTKESARRIRQALRQATERFGDDVSRWPRYMQKWPADLQDDVARVRELQRIARG